MRIEIDLPKGSKEIPRECIIMRDASVTRPEIDKYATPGHRMLINFAAYICEDYVTYLYKKYVCANQLIQIWYNRQKQK